MQQCTCEHVFMNTETLHNDMNCHFTVHFLPKRVSSSPVNSFIHIGSFQNICKADFISAWLKCKCHIRYLRESRVFLPDCLHSIDSKVEVCVYFTTLHKDTDAPSSVFSCFWRFRGTLLRARGCWRGMGCPRLQKTCSTSPRGEISTPATCCRQWKSFEM